MVGSTVTRCSRRAADQAGFDTSMPVISQVEEETSSTYSTLLKDASIGHSPDLPEAVRLAVAPIPPDAPDSKTEPQEKLKAT